MASKKKRRAGATTRAKAKAKTKAGTRKAKAGASKAKARASKAKAKPGASKAKAKPGASKAKAKKGASKAKASARRATAKGGARKSKPAAARQRTPKAVAKSPSPAERSTGPLILDEALEEPLVDASTILRVKDRVARSQRGADEDELNQFSDPSLVVEVDIETSDLRGGDEDTDEPVGLFAAEARRQKERLSDSAPGDAPQRREHSLFGSLGAGAPKENLDSDADSDAAPDDFEDD
jgi:hypothetical protein